MRIQRSAAEASVKKVSLELGGKNALIVLPDADLDAAVPGAVRGDEFSLVSESVMWIDLTAVSSRGYP